MVTVRTALFCWLSVALLVGCEGGRQHSPVGGELYARDCASCHGPDGHGDGPAANALEPRPADLTRSTLSLADLMARIDGRHALPAHGTSAMPVWGEVFDERLVAEPKAHEIIALRIRALAEHVRSLREHP